MHASVLRAENITVAYLRLLKVFIRASFVLCLISGTFCWCEVAKG